MRTVHIVLALVASACRGRALLPVVTRPARLAGVAASTAVPAAVPRTFLRQRGGALAPSMVASPAMPDALVNARAASSRLDAAFDACRERNEAAFIPFVTAGYPSPDDTVELLLAMQSGGADVIELGMPFSDPQADGATIQLTNQVALKNGVGIDESLELVNQARQRGLTTPVILMGYYNPVLQYGVEQLTAKAADAGVDGFIIVDLPPEEGTDFVRACAAESLAFVPLIAPTTTDNRIKFLSTAASSFIYCVSVTGVTGSRGALPSDLNELVTRVRAQTDLPLAVGFGITTPEHVQAVAAVSDAVVVGSAVLNTIDQAGDDTATRASTLQQFVASLKTGTFDQTASARSASVAQTPSLTDSRREEQNFGAFGGRYIPETLAAAHEELEAAYNEAIQDPAYLAELDYYRREFIGGPTPLYEAKRLTEKCGGARIWLKREDLAHTGAHKINNAVGQALLAKRLGKPRIIAETGAGQHGVATATVCAMLGLECVVYMGAVDCERQKLNVFRMRTLGATVVPVESGSRTLKDAINEAMRDWVTNVRDTHYLIGSAVGPHPFPTIVRDLQAVIGREARAQMLEKASKLPDAVVACVGGGSNAIGTFADFIPDESVRLVGVEAGGEGLGEGVLNSATLSKGTPGVLHGAKTYVLQTKEGQTATTSSISAGLDYPGVGPQHAFLKDSGRAEYVPVTDKQALEGFQALCEFEGIIPALETSHAVYHTMELAKQLGPGKDVLINLSGRGDKDMPTVARVMGVDVS